MNGTYIQYQGPFNNDFIIFGCKAHMRMKLFKTKIEYKNNFYSSFYFMFYICTAVANGYMKKKV